METMDQETLPVENQKKNKWKRKQFNKSVLSNL